MSKDDIKNYGKSIRSKLFNIAKEENVFYQTVLTRYFHERLLYRISQTRFRENFYLKGGALMYAYERFVARPTLDIDFLGNNINNDSSSIVEAFKEICSIACIEYGVNFDVTNITARNITELRDYHGVRLSIPVSMDTIAQVMTMDIGFGDVITPSPVNLDYPILLEHLPNVSILAYSLETVIAEKLHAVVDLADQSSRMKDYYDLFTILNNEQYDANILQEAVIRTFMNRHTSFDANTMFFRQEFPENQQMQIKWQAYIKKITKTTNRSFTEVATYIQEILRPYWENIPHV